MNRYILLDFYEIHHQERYQKWHQKLEQVNLEYSKTYKLEVLDLGSSEKEEYLRNITPGLSNNVLSSLVNWRDLVYVHQAQITGTEPLYWFIRPWLPSDIITKNIYQFSLRDRYLLPDRYCYSEGLVD